MDSASAFKTWIVKRLRYLIDLQNKSVAAVEKEMGRSRGYLGDALRGEKRLSLESLLEVLEHLGIDPAEFFRGPTAEEERWAKYPRTAGTELESAVADAEAVRGALISEDHDTRHLILALVRVLEAKGLLNQDDVLAALARLEE